MTPHRIPHLVSIGEDFPYVFKAALTGRACAGSGTRRAYRLRLRRAAPGRRITEKGVLKAQCT